MLIKLFNDSNITEKALDAAWLRNKIISDNITNVDTPGYKKKEVKFEELLGDISNSDFTGFKTDVRHIDIGKSNNYVTQIKISTDNSTSVRLDGNNVDIDNEMASMAKNTIKYNVLVQSMNSRFGMLKSVINGGR